MRNGIHFVPRRSIVSVAPILPQDDWCWVCPFCPGCGFCLLSQLCWMYPIWNSQLIWVYYRAPGGQLFQVHQFCPRSIGLSVSILPRVRILQDCPFLRDCLSLLSQLCWMCLVCNSQLIWVYCRAPGGQLFQVHQFCPRSIGLSVSILSRVRILRDCPFLRDCQYLLSQWCWMYSVCNNQLLWVYYCASRG